MRLRRIRKRVWDVLAIETDDGHCATVEFLKALRGDPGRLSVRMMAILRELAPANPPRKEPFCKRIENNLYEFRVRRSRGPVLRVIWFDDAGKIIVCTHAFLKDQPRTDPREVSQARLLRAEYFDAKQCGPIPITESET